MPYARARMRTFDGVMLMAQAATLLSTENRGHDPAAGAGLGQRQRPWKW